MNLPEHKETCEFCLYHPEGACNTCDGVPDRCFIDCPRCAVDKVIDLIKQKRDEAVERSNSSVSWAKYDAITELVVYKQLLKELEETE
jgi:excinuclease UvrABC ATPase subunit